MTTVSAVIPVYNVKEYLERCLDSALSQSVPFDRIIVVNDGSTDGCAEICASYAKKNATIQLINKENGGLVSAWMEGLKYVDTSHICFIDSDDFISPDYLACLKMELEEDIDLVSMQCIHYYNEMKHYKFIINGLPAGTYSVDNYIKSITLCDHGSPTRSIAVARWGKIIRTDLVRKYAQYCTKRISYGEDQQLIVGTILGSKKIKILNEYKYYYQLNPNSIINTYKKNMWENIIVLMETLRGIPGIEEIPNFDLQFNTQFLLHMSECFRNEFAQRTFNRSFYNRVVDNEFIQRALKFHSSEKMRRFDKAMCACAEKKNYYRTTFWLKLSEIILTIKK